jgi:hypothetical protein
MHWAKQKLTKAERASLKRLEREEVILAKAPKDLTKSEWGWLRKVMEKIIPEKPQGRKREQRYDDWMHQIARAKLRGDKPPRLSDLAGIKPPTNSDPALISAYKDKMESIRDAYKKAKKRRQLPSPPKR